MLGKDIVTQIDQSIGAVELTSRNAIITAIGVYILWGYITDWVPVLRYTPHAFVAGIIITMVVVGALTLYLMLMTARGVSFHKMKSHGKPRSFAFVAPEAWRKSMISLEACPVYDPAVLYPPSFFISDALNGVVDLILHNYVTSWYGNLCQSPSFPNEVDRALRAALVNLRDRMLAIDFVDVTVKRFLPIITEHFRAFDQAERSVQGWKLDLKLTRSEELDRLIAGEYREGRLHQAAQQPSADMKTLKQGHLRKIVNRLLPDLLPEDVIRCQVVSALLREVLACAVLLPLMQVLSDPDTWNRMVEAYGRSMLQDRRSLRKLRAALDELASTPPKEPAPVTPRKWLRNVRNNNLRRSAGSSTDLRSTPQHWATAAPQRHSFDSSPPRRLFPEEDHKDDFLAASAHRTGVNEVASSQLGGSQACMVEALETAMNDIIVEPSSLNIAHKSRFDTRGLGTRSLHNLASSGGPIGSPGAKFLVTERTRTKPNLVSLGLVDMPSGVGVFPDDDIFGEEEKLLEEERAGSGGAIVEGDSADEIGQAACGDLDLTAAIAALSSDIERLVVQQSIVDKMIRKAELINNVAELRIFNKSKLSLQRELQEKEFQRQRYLVRESDNNLYGRATVEIKSVMVGKAGDGQDYALYVIQTHRKAGQQIPAFTWTVGRRYREFHDLHQRLRVVYPDVRRLHFPRRRFVSKLQNDFLQKRRSSLEEYLGEILRIPEVCRTRDLQAFLSLQNISPANDSKGEVDQRDLVSRIYKSVTERTTETMGNNAVADHVSTGGVNLVPTTADKPCTLPQAAVKEPVSAVEVQTEPNAFESRELEAFVNPICDLLLEIFNLKRGQSWLRGRTVVAVLRQLLGGVVERKVREYAKVLVQEESVVGYINLVKESIWPAGHGTPGEAKIRTEAEKTKSRKAARIVLATVIPDLAGNIVGKANAQAASRRISATLNNPRLTTHLAFTLLDELVRVLFGDTRSR